MRFLPRRSTAGLFTALLLAGAVATGQPAAATEPSSDGDLPVVGLDAPTAGRRTGEPVSLVVGLKPGTDGGAPAQRLDARPSVEVVDTEPVTGIAAVTIDVPAEDRAEAAAALRTDPAVAYVEVDQVRRVADVTVNDEFRGDQWGFDRTGVPAAWARTTGSSAVTVAVVDTGVSATSDLAGALVAGYDFVNRDANPADDEGHGTLTASVIAAGADNITGGAGICWTCRIMPVKVLGADGAGYDSDVAAGIVWAADHGADIINLSLSGTATSTVLRNAVAHAVAKGVLVIAAAGNDGRNELNYPAAYPSVVAVGSADRTDSRYSWSNWGSGWVDVAAPGCNIAQANDGDFYDFCGTSSSTPFVAGVAALALAYSPAATAGQLSTALTSTTTALSGGWVSTGLVHADRAVQALPAAPVANPSVRITRPAAGSYVRGTVTFGAVLPADAVSLQALVDGAAIGTDTAAPWSLTWDTTGRNGATTVSLLATDAGGDTTTVTVPLTVDNTAPTVSFKSPASQAKVRGTVTVTANAADNLGLSRVELIVGGKVVATDRTAPWSLAWKSGKTNGPVTLTLRAVDRVGATASAGRSVTADNTVPSVKITSGPKDKAKVRGTVTVKASASDKYGVNRVEILVNGKVVGKDTRSPYSFKVNTAKYGKKLKVQVRAYDQAGNVKYAPTRTWYRS
jgi:subtilisin family serine protease